MVFPRLFMKIKQANQIIQHRGKYAFCYVGITFMYVW